MRSASDSSCAARPTLHAQRVRRAGRCAAGAWRRRWMTRWRRRARRAGPRWCCSSAATHCSARPARPTTRVQPLCARAHTHTHTYTHTHTHTLTHTHLHPPAVHWARRRLTRRWWRGARGRARPGGLPAASLRPGARASAGPRGSHGPASRPRGPRGGSAARQPPPAGDRARPRERLRAAPRRGGALQGAAPQSLFSSSEWKIPYLSTYFRTSVIPPSG
jgi:hypothetical protein